VSNATPEHEPQPGAIASSYRPNGLPPTDLNHDGWQTLPGYEAVNFVNAEPRLWPLTETVYRVWGAPASEYSKYWSPTDVPATPHEFYGGEAVQSSWNSGIYVASVTIEFLVSDPKPEGAPVWYGLSARQPASDIHGQSLPHSKFHLPGGTEQLWIHPSLLRRLNAASPWNAPPEATELPAPSAAGAAESAPTDPVAHEYWDLGHSVADLAALLLVISDEAERSGIAHAPLHAQAERLQRDADRLVAEAPNMPDQHAVKQCHRTALDLIGIARHLHPFHATASESKRVDELLNDIVSRAHKLGTDIV
jgi:hypothetical protein